MATPPASKKSTSSNTPASIAALKIPRIEHDKTLFDKAIKNLGGLKNLSYSPSFTSKEEAKKFLDNLNNIPYITVKKKYKITYSDGAYRISRISYTISTDEKTINADLDAKRIKTMYMRLYERNRMTIRVGLAQIQLFEDFLRLVAKFRQMRKDAADQAADQDDGQDNGFSSEYEPDLETDFNTTLRTLIGIYKQMSKEQKNDIPDALKPFFKKQAEIMEKKHRSSDLEDLANEMGGLSAGASKDGESKKPEDASQYVDLRF